MHWWRTTRSWLERAALVAGLSAALMACEGAAQQQSRQILERHKAELQACYAQRQELLTLATEQPPDDVQELKRRARRLQRLQQASGGDDCVTAFHRRVDEERAAAGIDPNVFRQVVRQTIPRWQKEWNVAGP